MAADALDVAGRGRRAGLRRRRPRRRRPRRGARVPGGAARRAVAPTRSGASRARSARDARVAAVDFTEVDVGRDSDGPAHGAPRRAVRARGPGRACGERAVTVVVGARARSRAPTWSRWRAGGEARRARPRRAARASPASARSDRRARRLGPAGLRALDRVRRAGDDLHLARASARDLQRSLIRSHAAGVGDDVETEVVRAMMVSRLSTLCTGRDRGAPVDRRRPTPRCSTPSVTPVVHEFGSLGCSGDLAPLAHVALALMGEGEVRDAGGRRMPAGRRAGRGRAEPGRAGREGGPRAHQRHRRHARDSWCSRSTDLERRSLTLADLAAAVSIQALRGTDRVFAADVVRRFARTPASCTSAANLARAARRLADRRARTSTTRAQVQDAYSLRCAPQVHGAARDTLAHAARVADVELASAHRQPVGARRRRARLERQLPRRAGRLRARLPGHRRRRRGLDGRAAHRPAARRRSAASACRRSWRTGRAWTRGS